MIIDRLIRRKEQREKSVHLTGVDLIRDLLFRIEQSGDSDALVLRQYLDESKIGVISSYEKHQAHKDGICVAIGLEDVPREAYVVFVVDDSAVNREKDRRFRQLLGEVCKHIRSLNLQGFPLGIVSRDIAISVVSNVKHDH